MEPSVKEDMRAISTRSECIELVLQQAERVEGGGVAQRKHVDERTHAVRVVVEGFVRHQRLHASGHPLAALLEIHIDESLARRFVLAQCLPTRRRTR